MRCAVANLGFVAQVCGIPNRYYKLQIPTKMPWPIARYGVVQLPLVTVVDSSNLLFFHGHQAMSAVSRALRA